MRKECIVLSEKAFEILMWMSELWLSGEISGPAFDLDMTVAESHETHPDVIALHELEFAGLVTLTENKEMKVCWTLAADLTDIGREYADQLRVRA
jgi:hypothetical protein